MGSPLGAELLDHAAGDAAAGGPIADLLAVCGGHGQGVRPPPG